MTSLINVILKVNEVATSVERLEAAHKMIEEDYTKAVLRVGTFESGEPHMFDCARTDFTVRSSCKYPGIIPEMLSFIFTKASIGYKLVPLPSGTQLGHRLDNGTWTGALGYLQKNQLDMIAADVAGTNDQRADFRVAVPYTHDQIMVAAPAGTIATTFWQTASWLVRMLYLEVWIAIALISLLFLATRLLAQFSFSHLEMSQFIIGLMLRKPYVNRWRNMVTMQLVGFLIAFLVGLSVAMYRSFLMFSLVLPPTSQFNNLASFLQYLEGAETDLMVRSTTSDWYQDLMTSNASRTTVEVEQLKSYLTINPPSTEPHAGVIMSKVRASKATFIGTSTQLQYEAYRQCDVRTFEINLGSEISTARHLIFRKNLPNSVFDKIGNQSMQILMIIGKMQDRYQHLRTDYEESGINLENCTTFMSTDIPNQSSRPIRDPLSIKQFYGLIVVAILFIIIAIITLVFEYFLENCLPGITASGRFTSLRRKLSMKKEDKSGYVDMKSDSWIGRTRL